MSMGKGIRKKKKILLSKAFSNLYIFLKRYNAWKAQAGEMLTSSDIRTFSQVCLFWHYSTTAMVMDKEQKRRTLLKKTVFPIIS